MFPHALVFLIIAYLIHTNWKQIVLTIKMAKNFFGFILVSQQQRNILFALYKMGCILCKSYYLRIIQKWNKTLVQLNKNTFELTYTINGNVYKTLIFVRRGPKKLLLALDQDNKDMTDLITMYLGPNYDFHHNEFTPDFFDKETVTFHLSNGEEKTFTRYELLQLQTT
jgi:hypothetical protein